MATLGGNGVRGIAIDNSRVKDSSAEQAPRPFVDGLPSVLLIGSLLGLVYAALMLRRAPADAARQLVPLGAGLCAGKVGQRPVPVLALRIS